MLVIAALKKNDIDFFVHAVALFIPVLRNI
jgi:hypothetical protein